MSMITEFVKELRERLREYGYSHLVEHDTEECLHCRENEDVWCNCRNCFICVWDKAEAIVKELAEEYNNDFCEWEKVVIDSTELIREPHRMYLFKEFYDKWEYCPYCGKKTKIAPYQPKGE